MSSAEKMIAATKKCESGPARMTSARCRTGFAPYARSSSPGGTSFSNGFIPAIFTYPPAGIAFNPYSISPRRNDHSFGPNPTKYSRTRNPNLRANR